jgi:exosortase/archaeosortase family protein
MKDMVLKLEDFKKNYIEYYYAVCIISVYGFWKLIKAFSATYSQSLDSFGTSVNEAFAQLYVNAVGMGLSILSLEYSTFFTATSYGEFIGIAIEGSSGVYVAYHCLGVTASLVFAITLLLLPGSWKRKIKYLILGLIALFLANTVRIGSLVLMDKYLGKFWVDLNHSLIFVVMFYGLLLLFHFMFLRRLILKRKSK